MRSREPTPSNRFGNNMHDPASDGRNIAPSVTRILYSKFVAGASDCHLLGYSLLAKIFVNFRDVLLAYFLLAKIRA
jgi:hypothetical protein